MEPKKRVLIVGGSSLLGRYMLNHCNTIRYEVLSTHYCNAAGKHNYQLDITNMNQVKQVFMYARPDIVVLLAAIGSVDFCEKDPLLAHLVNVDGTRNIANACMLYNARLVFLSTNAVFDGTHPPYKEEDTRNPLSIYGFSKMGAENVVFDVPNSLTVRTERLFGKNWSGGRPNWVDISISKLKLQQTLEVVNDDMNRPTYAGHLADTIWTMISRGLTGVYHAAGSDIMSLYDFVYRIACTYNYYYDHSQLDLSLLQPVPSSKFSNLAARPADTTYDLSKLNAEGLEVGSCIYGLDSMARLEEL